MGQQQPVTRDTLGKDIQHGEKDRLSIDTGFQGQGSSRDGTVPVSTIHSIRRWGTERREKGIIHWEEGKHNQTRSRESPKEASERGILSLCRALSMESRMVQNNQIPNTRKRQPGPSCLCVSRERA